MTDVVDYCKTCFHVKEAHFENQNETCSVPECECVYYIHGETRVTSSTGASKGTKDARYDLIPVPALDALARLYGFGAKKYAEHNWRLGYDWSKSYAAAQRHMNAFWQGENIDPETQVPHPINAAFHMFALATYLTEHPEFDDRFETRDDQLSMQGIIGKAFDNMAATLGVPTSSAESSRDSVIESTAQEIANSPRGSTVTFHTDFSQDDIAKVFARAQEIKNDRLE